MKDPACTSSGGEAGRKGGHGGEMAEQPDHKLSEEWESQRTPSPHMQAGGIYKRPKGPNRIFPHALNAKPKRAG